MITIYMPTYNRLDYLKRALFYYSKNHFTGTILIGDSSGDTVVRETEELIKSLPDLKITYFRCPPPPYPVTHIWSDLASKITTKYCIASGDDDLLVPNHLTECVNFLENNDEYVAAHGLRYGFFLDRDGPYGGIRSVGLRPEPEFTSDDPIERMQTFSVYNCGTAYYLIRSEVLKKMYPRIDFTPPAGFLMDETYPGYILAMSGKTKKMNCISVFMQQHSEKVFYWDRDQNAYTTIIHENFYRTIQYMRKNLLVNLEEKYGSRDPEFIYTIDSLIWLILNDIMNSHYYAFAKHDNHQATGEKSALPLRIWRFGKKSLKKIFSVAKRFQKGDIDELEMIMAKYPDDYNELREACSNSGEDLESHIRSSTTHI